MIFVKKILSIHKKRIEGIIHTINDNISDRVDYKKTKSNILFGKNKINETINELTFQVSMSSFFKLTQKPLKNYIHKFAIMFLKKK